MKRKCPNCNKEIVYKTKSQYNDAVKNNRVCKSCSNKLRKKLDIPNLTRTCIKCGLIHTFSSKYKLPDGEYICKSCKTKLRMTNRIVSDETKKKISDFRNGKTYEDLYGKEKSIEIKNKLKELNTGKNNNCYGRVGNLNPMFGRRGSLSPTYGQIPWNKGVKSCFSDETILKMKKSKRGKWKGNSNPNFGNHLPLCETHKMKLRQSLISRFERLDIHGYQKFPGFNLNACHIIKQYGEENGYNFQTAIDSGGEFEFRGFFADGYDIDKNVWIEYFEKSPHHYQNGEIIKKDWDRLLEIKKHLNCKIIILEETGNKILI